MTKRTRLFIGTMVSALVVGIGVGLAAMYMGLPVLAQLGGGRGELEYLPQDARLVAFANVRDVMDSELRQKLRELQPERTEPPADDPAPEPRTDFFREAGLDLETDVDLVFVSLTGDAEAGTERPLVLARGRFDDDLIETLIRQRGGQASEHRGVRVLVHQEDDQSLGLAFVEPGLVAFGGLSAVQGAIDAKAGAAPSVTSNAQVMAMIGEVDDGNTWAVGRFDAIAGRTPLPRELSSQLPPLSWFSARGHINGGVEGLLRVETRDEAAAQDLRDVLQGFLALARLQASQLDQFRAMINSITLGGQGTTVSVTFTVPSDAIDALAALQRERRGAGISRPTALPPGI